MQERTLTVLVYLAKQPATWRVVILREGRFPLALRIVVWVLEVVGFLNADVICIIGVIYKSLYIHMHLGSSHSQAKLVLARGHSTCLPDLCAKYIIMYLSNHHV